MLKKASSASIMVLAALLLLPALASALEPDHPAVKVRVTGYDPATHVYNISCAIPPTVDQRRFFAIDPIPAIHNTSEDRTACNNLNQSTFAPCYRSYNESMTWHLDPMSYREIVHKKALYHMYCEVQNYSAPSGQQNMPSEIHVDLRTEPNVDVPNIYVLRSAGTLMTMKCDPPAGVRNFTTSWSIRSRSGTIGLPELGNQRIVNITIPVAGSGWDVVCSVFDRDAVRTTQWDMPIETALSGDAPAYIPTIEGCIPWEPCLQVSPDGIVPNGTAIVTAFNSSNATLEGSQVFINEELKGVTGANGQLAIPDIVPGIYNLVLRTPQYEELSTLIPIATGASTQRSYTILRAQESAQAPANGTNATNQSGTCYSSSNTLPPTCAGGTITQDTIAGCRTIVCTAGSQTLQVMACNKPDNSNAQYFEMYRQADTGNLQICLGTTCIKDNGYAKSPTFPICTSTQNTTNQTNTTQPPQNITFATTAPAGLSPTIAEPNSQTFTYTLSNPSALTTTTQWILDDITQAASAASYTFQGNYTTNGTHNVTVIVSSTQNTIRATWILTVTDTAQAPPNGTNTTTNQTTTCHTGVSTIPPACAGGTIIQDTVSGNCRTLTCTSGDQSLKALACNKPDSGIAQYFEMYRQADTGNLQICLGTTCIKDNGYAKSPTFPICTSTQNTTNQTNTTQPPQNITFATTAPAGLSPTIAEPNSQTFTYTLSNPSALPTTTQWRVNGELQSATGASYLFAGNYSAAGAYNVSVRTASSQNTIQNDWQLTVTDTVPPNATCHTGVSTMPPACTGGTIIQDTVSGNCRTLTCTSGDQSLKALACNKPDGASSPQYFELYKQQQIGSEVSQLCLGTVCVGSNGYAKSQAFPIC